MADADEIPVSQTEQAFLDAMKAIQGVQETNATADDVDPASISGDAGPAVQANGHDDNSSDPTTMEVSVEGDARPQPNDESAVTSVPETSTAAAAAALSHGIANDSTLASTSVLLAQDTNTEAQPSTRTTPPDDPHQLSSSYNAPSMPDQAALPPPKTASSGKRKRLPQDMVGQLEDRIAADPKGDVNAWLSLIEEHKRKGRLDDARAVYGRFFEIFPQAAQEWISYVRMELDNNEFTRVEQIFSRSLLTVPNVDLWSLYLDYIRRRNNLTNDPSGRARGIISQAYDFVLNNIGCDREAGRIWQDQIAFVKSAPGNIGGTTWMDQQKMDTLRKVYQKAVTQPVTGVEVMWREYDSFEHGLNKLTAKKFLQEKSPAFMTARACLIELNNLTKGLKRETLPRLPPAPGYDGDDDWNYQVSLWKRWIKWEKEDPVVLAKEDPGALRNRIVFAYKQALMALRFWPEMWFEAAEYCFDNDLTDQGMEFLKQGLVANPESTLLTFKYAERLEATIPTEDGEAAAIRKGQMVRKPYDDLLTHLYELYAKMQAKEREEIEKLEQSGAETPQEEAEDDDDEDEEELPRQSEKEKAINEVKEKSKAELLKLSKVISATWIDLMRTMRRIQGHGRVNEALGGSRQIFADARKKGKITSDVYVASALIEYHCYRDPAANKIFERGMKLFPQDEDFALEYLKFLVYINDITNARAMFETFVSKVPADKAQRVYRFFYEYEAHYGDLAQVYKLEKRMAELYPSDHKLEQFAARYSYRTVDPTKYLPVISPVQTKPKFNFPLPPEEAAAAGLPIPPPPLNPIGGTFNPPPPPVPIPPPSMRIGSPKRAAEDDDFSSRARKLPRPDSPVPVLKGAAGRRLNQIKQQQAAAAAAGGSSSKDSSRREYSGTPSRRDRDPGTKQQDQNQLPEAVLNLLRIMPGADKYTAVRFNPEAMVALLAGLQLPDASYYGN